MPADSPWLKWVLRTTSAVVRLFYIAAQIKFAASLSEDAIEARFYIRGQILTLQKPLSLATNCLQRLNEVAALQLSGIVGHWRR